MGVDDLSGRPDDQDRYLDYQAYLNTRFDAVRFDQDIERAQRYAARQMAMERTAPERDMLATTPVPETARYVLYTFASDLESTTSEATLLVNRYAAIEVYATAMRVAKMHRLGGDKDLSDYLGLEEHGFTGHMIIPPFELEEITIPPELLGATEDNDKAKAAVAQIRQRNEAIRKARQVHEASFAVAESNRARLILELESGALMLNARVKLNGEMLNYNASGGDITEWAKDFLLPKAHQVTPDDLISITRRGPIVQRPVSVGPNSPEMQRYERMRLKNPELVVDFRVAFDEALRIKMIIGACEDPVELMRLRNTPGWEMLFPNTADGNAREEKWVGRVNEWTIGGVKFSQALQKAGGDYDKALEEWGRGKRTLVEFDREVKGNAQGSFRGILTRKGNLYARNESSKERDDFRNNMAKFCGSKNAEETAETVWRLMGGAAEAGCVIYWSPDGKQKIIFLEGAPDASDDMAGKVMHVAAKREKDHAKNRPAGPDNTIDAYDRIGVSWFRWGAWSDVNDDDLLGLPDDVKDSRKFGRTRSVYERMWGYKAKGTLPAEAASRFGDLKFDKLATSDIQIWKLAIFYAGRKGGLLDFLVQIGWDPKAAASRDTWTNLNKWIDLCVGSANTENGVYRGKSFEEVRETNLKAKKVMKAAIIRGIAASVENRQWLVSSGGAGFSNQKGQETLDLFTKREAKFSE